MHEQLKAIYSDAQREAAAALGEDSQLSADDRVIDLFEALGDPQLSSVDVHELLGGTSTLSDIEGAVERLVESEQLEVSDSTQRPFDSADVRLYRLATDRLSRLRIIALEVLVDELDGESVSRYQFSMDGRLIRSIAKVDRLDALAGQGQQRNEIKKHVEKIAEGIRGGNQVPNAVLLVIDSEYTWVDPDPADDVPESWVAIRPLDTDWMQIENPTGRPAQLVRLVEIDLPFRLAAFDDEKRCLLVDGQQRTAALTLVPVDDVETFSLSVNAIVTSSDAAKQIFQVANDTVKIATDFSRALLASMKNPPSYRRDEARRVNATRTLALEDETSPFFGLVKYPGVGRDPDQVIVHNSLYQIVQAFDKKLSLDGDSGENELVDVVSKAYKSVQEVWPHAWGKKVSESKLMHGAGLRSMAEVLVDHLSREYSQGKALTDKAVWTDLRESLERMAQPIQWTEADVAMGTKAAQGNWKREIVDRQNTSKDISELATFLRKTKERLDHDANRGTTGGS